VDTLGNIKTHFVKRIGKELYENYAERFTSNYSENKKLIKDLIDIRSKKLRNIVAGYVTNLKNQEKKVSKISESKFPDRGSQI